MIDQFQEPLDLTSPPIWLPMATGRALRHLIDNMGFFDVGVELESSNRIEILDTNDLFAGNGIALEIEDDVEHNSLTGLEHALAEIHAVPIILLVRIVEDSDIAHGISAQCFGGRYWDTALAKL